MKKKKSVGEMFVQGNDFLNWLRTPEGIEAMKNTPSTGIIIDVSSTALSTAKK